MGRKIKDVPTIDKVEKKYKIPISNLVSPKAYSASLEQIAELAGDILEVDERFKASLLETEEYEALTVDKMQTGVFYCEMEESDEPTPTPETSHAEYSNGYVLFDAVYSNGYVEADATYSNGLVKI